jgi:hypothetical protein
MMFHNDTNCPEGYTYLSWNSYTIGESVCETCRFPAQLSKKLDLHQKIHIPSNNCEQAGLQPTCFIATQNPLTI